MPTNYAGAVTYPAEIQIPSDGDPLDAASVNAALEGLADRTAYLKDKTAGWGHMSLSASHHDEAQWSTYLSAGPPAMAGLRQEDTAFSYQIDLQVPLAPRQRITSLAVMLVGDGGGAAHVGVPATKPYFTLYKMTAGARTTIGTVTDAPADLAEYQGDHGMVMSGLALDAIEDTTYWIVIGGESGANAVNDALVVWDVRYEQEPAP